MNIIIPLVSFCVDMLVCAAALQAARRKGRTPFGWGIATFFFPPTLLLLELLSGRPSKTETSNLVLEWVASLLMIAFVASFAAQLLMVLATQ